MGNVWARITHTLSETATLLAALGVVGLLGGLSLAVWIPELLGFAAGTAIVGGALLVSAAIGALPKLRLVFSVRRRQATFRVITVTTLVVSGILVLNLFALESSLRWDASASKEFTLAPQTKMTLRNMQDALHVSGFFAPSDISSDRARAEASQLLMEFKHYSNGKLTYEIIDAESNPSKPRALGVNSFPSLVFQARNNESALVISGAEPTEQKLLASLLITTKKKQKVVYFLAGHQERDFQDVDHESSGYGLFATGLIYDGYQIRILNLAQTGEVPSDAAAIIVASPRKELLAPEQQILSTWLRQGGNAVFLLDPSPPESFVRILLEWGIEVQRGAIFDPGRSITGDPRTPLLRRSDYQSQKEPSGAFRITELLDVVFFPDATAFNLTEQASQAKESGKALLSYTQLALTSPASVLLDIDGTAAVNTPGPHTLIIAAEGTLQESDDNHSRTSIVAFGDSDFASNRFYDAYTNSDLLLNAVNWVSKDFDLISIRSNPTTYRQLIMTRQEFNFVRFSSWFLLPVLMIAVGIVIWWRRR